MSVTDIRVFMGGTCAGYKWRDKLRKITYGNARMYSPRYETEIQRNHTKERLEKADVVLFVVSPNSRGMASLVEVTDQVNKKPNKVVLCVIDGYSFEPETASTVQMVREIVLNNGGCVYESLHDVADHINLLCEYGLQFTGERLAHLCKTAHQKENRAQREIARENGERVKLSPKPQNGENKKRYEILAERVTIGNVRKFKGIRIECPFCLHEYSIRYNDLAHRGKRCPQCSAQAMQDGFSYKTSRY